MHEVWNAVVSTVLLLGAGGLVALTIWARVRLFDAQKRRIAARGWRGWL